MDLLNKELTELRRLIKKSARSPKQEDLLFGIYQYWAEFGAIKNICLTKGIINHDELEKEMVPILTSMKRDFK